jgi:hypothetical protein
LEIVSGRTVPLVVSLIAFTGGAPTTATCADLPEGATCIYDEKNQTVTITPATNTPPGGYLVRVTVTAEP